MFCAEVSLMYVTVNPDPLLSKLESCIEDIRIWIERNFQKLNESNTEFIIFGFSINLSNLCVPSVTVGDCNIPIASSVKNWVMTDSLPNMDNFDQTKTRSVNMNLRKCSCIQKFPTQDTSKSLVQATIQSRLNYCSSFQNSTECLVLWLPSYDHSFSL